MPVSQLKTELSTSLTPTPTLNLDNRLPQGSASHEYLSHLQQQQQHQPLSHHLLHPTSSATPLSTTQQPIYSSSLQQYNTFNPITSVNNPITSSMLSAINTTSNTQNWSGVYPIPGTIATCMSYYLI